MLHRFCSVRRTVCIRPKADLEKDTAYAVAVESDEEVWIE